MRRAGPGGNSNAPSVSSTEKNASWCYGIYPRFPSLCHVGATYPLEEEFLALSLGTPEVMRGPKELSIMRTNTCGAWSSIQLRESDSSILVLSPSILRHEIDALMLRANAAQPF